MIQLIEKSQVYYPEIILQLHPCKNQNGDTNVYLMKNLLLPQQLMNTEEMEAELEYNISHNPC